MSSSSNLDLVYDRLVADEKLKHGTKYERLAAIVFASLEGKTVVHDLRLRGTSGVSHQIDVTVGSAKARLLVECKNYDKKIGLATVRDFFAVVEDVRPDAAAVVTTIGYTAGAVKYAEAKGIRLTLLRAARPSDLEGKVQRVSFTLIPEHVRVSGIEWIVGADDEIAAAYAEEPGTSAWPNEMRLVSDDGRSETVEDFLGRGGIDLAGAYQGDPGPRKGEHEFPVPQTLVLPDGRTLRVLGLRWSGQFIRGEHTFEVGYGIGDLVAELALLTASGEVLQVLSNRQIARFSFDRDRTVRRQ